MRRVATTLFLFCLLVVPLAEARAEEVVKFTDGRYLKIDGHKLFETVIRFDIGGNGTIVVPASLVESIEKNGVEKNLAQLRGESAPAHAGRKKPALPAPKGR